MKQGHRLLILASFISTVAWSQEFSFIASFGVLKVDGTRNLTIPVQLGARYAPNSLPMAIQTGISYFGYPSISKSRWSLLSGFAGTQWYLRQSRRGGFVAVDILVENLNAPYEITDDGANRDNFTLVGGAIRTGLALVLPSNSVVEVHIRYALHGILYAGDHDRFNTVQLSALLSVPFWRAVDHE